jgi:small-conductance mechanosensitive channel
MDYKKISETLVEIYFQWTNVLQDTSTYYQLLLVSAIFLFSYLISRRIRKHLQLFSQREEVSKPTLHKFSSKFGGLIFPLITIALMTMSIELSSQLFGKFWLVRTALVASLFLFYYTIIRDYIKNEFVAFSFRWVGLPLLFLHWVDLLDPTITILESMQVTVGNINVSAYGVTRVLVFGSLLFWLGRISSTTGQELIRRQEKLDFRTKEVSAKLLEVAIFILFLLLLLQVMGINLTALAVFGGALGVGLGLGLQAIASNFISGIIILLDRSISVDDYIELEDGRTGVVRELTLRSTTLETFDGKDIMVPNERFMTESFTNWTHKNKKQRYRVDFSVAYDSDIRKLVEIIKQTVSSHKQVISGDDVPIEERPDCEISGFGDSGVNMFVEFWMYGIDDGKNRVGGDLMLMIFEAMREHGFQIPFPQREVRILNENKPC